MTVKELKVELNKFPDGCVCFAYEGEISGLIIEPQDHNLFSQGVIYTNNERKGQENKKTELIKSLVIR